MFQSVEISPGIRAEPRLQGGVEFATGVLGQTVGHSSSLLRLRWDKASDDRGRPLVRMTLEDWTGKVDTYFAPDDLTSEESLRGRFYKVYGDLLQIRSHKQLEELLATTPSDSRP